MALVEADGSDGGHGEGERQPLREPTCRRRCCQVAPAPVVRAAQPALHRAEARLEGKEEQYTLPDHASGAPPLAALSLSAHPRRYAEQQPTRVVLAQLYPDRRVLFTSSARSLASAFAQRGKRLPSMFGEMEKA
jgi:hypothetical protein